MVKFIVSTFLLFATLSGLAFASPLESRGINKFIEDLHHLSGGISHLASAVNAIGTKLTIKEAVAIHSSATEVQAEFDEANSEVKGVHHVTYTEAKNVIGVTAGFAPVIVQALERFGEKKHVIAKFPGVSIPEIKKAIVGLHNSATELTTAIVRLEPSKFEREAKDIKSEINAAFDKAIKIYS